jgi:hypothetical protein
MRADAETARGSIDFCSAFAAVVGTVLTGRRSAGHDAVLTS